MDQGSAATEFRKFVRGLPKVSAEWDPFAVHVIDQSQFYARLVLRDYVLGMYMGGRHLVRRVVGANVAEGWSGSGIINLTPPNVDEVWEATGSSRCAVIVMRPEFVSRAIEEHWDMDQESKYHRALHDSRSCDRGAYAKSCSRNHESASGRTAVRRQRL